MFSTQLTSLTAFHVPFIFLLPWWKVSVRPSIEQAETPPFLIVRANSLGH